MRRSLLAILALAAACRPDFGDRVSLVDHATVIAVIATPPENAPDQVASYTVVVATPAGTLPAPIAEWSFCATPKLLTDDGSVSAACADGTGVRPVGESHGTIAAPTPADACSLFGPETTSADLRPRDADVTGGFYQPMRVTASGVDGASFGFLRISCDLARASAEVVTQFAASYVPNKNPVLLPLTADVPLDAVARGARVTLRASWTPADAETYPVYDVTSGTLAPHRESMRVAWYATVGAFDHDVTGRDETDLATFTENAWTAPQEGVAVHVWAVLRDSRGGAVVGEASIDVGE